MHSMPSAAKLFAIASGDIVRTRTIDRYYYACMHIRLHTFLGICTSASNAVESTEPFFVSRSTSEHMVPWRNGARQASRKRQGERRYVLIREVVVGAEMIRTLVMEVSCAKNVGCTMSDKIGTAATIEAGLMP